MKNFITTENWSKNELQDILDYAKDLKINRFQKTLKNKSIGLLFFNPSLRTRTSFEIGIKELGGFAVVLQPGKDAWPIEFKLNSIMDNDKEEHIIEVAKVLSEYCDLIAIRAFPKFQNLEEDFSDNLINSFAKYASVPVINMETYYTSMSRVSSYSYDAGKFRRSYRKRLSFNLDISPKTTKYSCGKFFFINCE
jgi:N-acetylornithine carbamoyltransferase